MARGLRLEVEINDTDPYREFSAPMPPRRMDTVQSAEWRKILDEAFDILTLWHPGYARELAAGLRMVTPLSPGGTVKGASSSVAIGAVGAAGTGSATALAETLVHEFQHSKVNGLLNLFDVGGQHVATYAPWRDDPRPLTGLLHGVFAFFSVAEFWRIQRDLVPPHEKPAADFTFALRRHQVIEAVSSLRHHPALTAVGKRLVEAIDARLGPLRLQPIEPELAATIATITDDHRATWRLQHTRPDPQDLVRLSNAWLVAVPAPTVAPSKVVLNSRSRTRSARRDLLLLKATEPDRFAETMRHSAVSSADSAFLTGDYATAAIGYTTLVQTMPHDVDSWIGLGLSMRAQGNAAATAILDSPEVVVALYRKILARTGTGPDLPRLTGWLSSVAVGVE
ncbi:aKG-HExxH-type peptide beta-hydroxylase [Kibdelosporangium persicum]|nr:HEXXH motif-containing putative peptide modification protein [Kibdelosporangium persicum]